MARIEILLTFVVALGAAASPAGAQPAEPGDPTARAADAFQRAQTAAAEEDFVTALEAFREAQQFAPHDAVRFNIGLCLERLGRFSEALAEFEHASASSQLSEEQRVDARARAEQAHARMGKVRVTSPTGARVSVDGIERCEAPCTIELDPGQHRVSAEGSLDARIGDEVANDFAAFFAAHRAITHVFFNGAKAEACYRRHVAPDIGQAMRYARLPSTSPAHAALTMARKRAAWRAILKAEISS